MCSGRVGFWDVEVEGEGKFYKSLIGIWDG